MAIGCWLLAVGFRFKTSCFRLVFLTICLRLSVSSFRLSVSGFRFVVSGFRFPASAFRLPLSGIRLLVLCVWFPVLCFSLFAFGSWLSI